MRNLSSSTLAVYLIYASAAILGDVSAWTCDSPRNVTLTKSMLDDLKQQIKRKIAKPIINDPDGQPYKSLVPGFVRLPFHTCSAKFCSSRIDLADPGNSGIQHVVQAADKLHAALQRNPKYTGFSKADLYALGGVAALEVATGGRIQVNFRYGRPDFCPSRDNPKTLGQLLPSTEMDTDNTYAFMQKVFNFTQRETVTIMGAHSIGVLRDLSGKPLWRWADKPADILTNDYYQRLLDNRWRQTDRPVPGQRGPFLQWVINGSPTKFMLNTDIGLVRRISPASNDNSGRSRCTRYLSCFLAPTSSTIIEYATNEGKFINDFSIVFGKMIENGLGGKLRSIVA